MLSIEVLAECIRKSPRITGVTIPHSMDPCKCSGYADDTTVAVTTDSSIEETFNVYNKFERASGARLNRGKSKGMRAGSWKDCQDTPYGLQWVKQLPLLGATFSVGDYSTPTWEPAVNSLETRLSAWAGRQLSFRCHFGPVDTLIWRSGSSFGRANEILWHVQRSAFPKPKGVLGLLISKIIAMRYYLSTIASR